MFSKAENAIDYDNKSKFIKTKIKSVNHSVRFVQEDKDAFQISFNKDILYVLSY